MNLLVLRLATINAEEQVAERLEAAEAAKQAVHLEGDVINPNVRKFYAITEKPEQCETISVCSCACMDNGLTDMWRKRQTRNKKLKAKKNAEQSHPQTRNKKRFLSFLDKPAPVKRLFKLNKKSKDKELSSVGTAVPQITNETNNYELKSIQRKGSVDNIDLTNGFLTQLNQIDYINSNSSNKNSGTKTLKNCNSI